MSAGLSPPNGTGGNSTTGSPRPRPTSAVNFGPELLIAIWTMSALSIIVVAMRSVSNAKFGNFEISDIVTLLALVSA